MTWLVAGDSLHMCVHERWDGSQKVILRFKHAEMGMEHHVRNYLGTWFGRVGQTSTLVCKRT